VGEDASFDLELIGHGCLVISIDPTPRAISYGNQLAGEQDGFRLLPIGLWSAPARLRFYAPRDPSHVSHSVVNLQGTSDYFEADRTTVRLLADQLGHDHLDLLKLDIEGAEFEVLASELPDGPLPETICVEFRPTLADGNHQTRCERSSGRRIHARCDRSLERDILSLTVGGDIFRRGHLSVPGQSHCVGTNMGVGACLDAETYPGAMRASQRA
jgi:hypothetical protein